MKKYLLILIIAFSSNLFSQISFTSTKNWSGSSVSVDGNGTCGNVLPTVSFAASDFGGCPGSTYSITDVNVFIGWCKQDGTCAAPGNGAQFHNETNFCVYSPATNVTLASAGTWGGGNIGSRMDTWFDQSGTVIPAASLPADGTWRPNGGNLNTLNGTSPIGAWNVRPGDTGGGDPLCVNQYQIQVTATVIPPGNPAVFGSNQWNVYAYQGNDYNLGGGVTYYGYYVEPLLSYDSRNRWGSNNSPADASGYQGCDPGINNHTVVSKRQGFPCAVYQINVPNHDDDAQLFINGTQEFNHNGCCDSHNNVWTGVLGASDQVEFRHGEGGSESHQGLQFVDVTTTLNAGSITYSGDLSACVGYNPPAFGSSATASGGASASITNGGTTAYQWQLNGSNIGGATGAAYNPGTINTAGTYIYRRRVTDRCGTVAYTNTFTITIVADPSTPTVTKSPNTSGACLGVTLTVTSPSSTGGTGTCIFEYRFSIDGGTTYSLWSSSVPSFAATGVSDNRIQTRRVCSGTGCNTSGSNTQIWTISEPSTDPTSATASSNLICAGEDVTLTVVGGSLGTGALWRWYSDPGFTSGVVIGSPETITPTTTETYYVRAEGTCNTTAGVNTGLVVVNGVSTLPTSATLPPATAASACIVNDNNWHHFFDENGDLLASINSNNQNLGLVKVSIEVGSFGPYGVGLAPGVCGYSGVNNGELALARNWDIIVDVQPTFPVDVIFYYESTEVSDLTDTISNLAYATDYISCWGDVASEADLMMTVNHSAGGTQLFPTIGASAVIGPGPGIREVAFQLSEFSSGKLHSNGGIHSGNPLPVELLSFEAKPIDNEYIALNWSTATEINNDGFELMRSTDGENFEKIAWVKGNGNTSQKQAYNYNDTKVSNIMYYYKLRQIDFDGAFEDFNVISAILNSKYKNTEIVVRPIPTSNTITLDIESASNSNSVISVYNFSGQKVLEINKKITEGKNSLTLEEINDLSSGIYYINLMVDNKTFTKKFVVSK